MARHIGTFRDEEKTAANLATAELQNDWYHSTLNLAARYLVAKYGHRAKSIMYQTAWASGTTCWFDETDQVSISVSNDQVNTFVDQMETERMIG